MRAGGYSPAPLFFHGHEVLLCLQLSRPMGRKLIMTTTLVVRSGTNGSSALGKQCGGARGTQNQHKGHAHACVVRGHSHHVLVLVHVRAACRRWLRCGLVAHSTLASWALLASSPRARGGLKGGFRRPAGAWTTKELLYRGTLDETSQGLQACCPPPAGTNGRLFFVVVVVFSCGVVWSFLLLLFCSLGRC